jgi:hypothetical protein
MYLTNKVTRDEVFGCGTELVGTSMRVCFRMGSLGFFIDMFFPVKFLHGIESDSIGKEKIGSLLLGKGSRCIELTTLLRSCFGCLQILEALTFCSFNPFQSNFSANRILPSSYLFWSGERLLDYL